MGAALGVMFSAILLPTRARRRRESASTPGRPSWCQVQTIGWGGRAHWHMRVWTHAEIGPIAANGAQNRIRGRSQGKFALAGIFTTGAGSESYNRVANFEGTLSGGPIRTVRKFP